MTLTAAVFVFASACAVAGEDEEYRVSPEEFEITATNGLTKNSLTKNSLTKNSLTKNALTGNSLTKNSLESQSLLSGALANDAAARTVLAYVYSCAMPATASMTLTFTASKYTMGGTYTFTGGLNLAPEWGTGACGQSCQRWVSACVISRLNALGTPIPLSLRGQHPMLSNVSPKSTEGLYYTKREASFYGNIFTEPMQLFACDETFFAQSAVAGRTCGENVEYGQTSVDCGLYITGYCSQDKVVYLGGSPIVWPKACTASTTDPGYQAACRDPATAQIAWPEVITTYMNVKY